MFKGVNKRVIEVVETENEFFEKAILFMRPTAVQTDDKQLMNIKAKQYVSTIEYSTKARLKSKLFLRMVLRFAGSAAIGALIATILLKI